VSALPALASDPDVVHVSIDHKVHSHLDVAAKTINAPMAWSSGYTGTGIGVAVIDSGINSGLQDFGNSLCQNDGAHSRLLYKENFLYTQKNGDGT
jgi:serine protease AprX